MARCSGSGGSRVALAIACAILVASAFPALADAAPGKVTIKVLSNRADVISGGDALVQVVRPRDARRARFKVTVGGRDVSGAFRKDGVGLIEGLENGRNVVGGRRAKTVRGARRRVAVRLGARKGRTVRVLLKVRARRGGQRVTLSVRHTYQRCE